jgi:heme/copper-type cytochrome/quinol oxidase subunit 2
LKAVSPITLWLSRTNGFWFSCYTATAAFCLYTCIFALRKTFGVATYENNIVAGVDFKVWMVIFQLIGYMLSKFIGIKVVSELGNHARAKGILLMVSIAGLSWLFFALTPTPYNLIFLFFNGLPLGMVWGMVFGYLEGRKFTEVLGASLSVSFIFSSGFAKTVGGLILQAGISEFWMPFVSVCLFFIPLLIFLWLLDKIPPPTAEDEDLRTKRAPMSKQERIKFAMTFLPGLILLVLAYTLLTVYRDFRDNFSSEIWISLGYGDKPSIFSSTEIPVTIVVLIVIASLMLIKNNYKALVVNHIIVLIGFVVVGLSTYAFQEKWINAPTWMVLIGMGLYFGYIQFNSIFFDRLIATFKYVSTVGFLIYLADSIGYLGSASILFYREFGQKQLSWLEFFMSAGYVVSMVGSALIILSLLYFRKKFKSHNIQSTSPIN